MGRNEPGLERGGDGKTELKLGDAVKRGEVKKTKYGTILKHGWCRSRRKER